MLGSSGLSRFILSSNFTICEGRWQPRAALGRGAHESLGSLGRSREGARTCLLRVLAEPGEFSLKSSMPSVVSAIPAGALWRKACASRNEVEHGPWGLA